MRERVNVENFDGSKQVGILYVATGVIKLIVIVAKIPYLLFRRLTDFKSVTRYND